jgi:hypothetical protein
VTADTASQCLVVEVKHERVCKGVRKAVWELQGRAVVELQVHTRSRNSIRVPEPEARCRLRLRGGISMLGPRRPGGGNTNTRGSIVTASEQQRHWRQARRMHVQPRLRSWWQTQEIFLQKVLHARQQKCIIITACKWPMCRIRGGS